MIFVCSVVGGDAGEDLGHIVTRKEAERSAGKGEFWWGLAASLGPNVDCVHNTRPATIGGL
jgi:hypothetical protein